MRSLLLCSIFLFGCTQTLQDPLLKRQADARIALGLGYLERGHYVKAGQSLSKAIEYQPNYYRAQLALARYLNTVNEIDKASLLYKQALSDNPNNGDVLNNYGTFLCQHGHFQQAEALFLQAIQSPNYYDVADSYENAALCEMKSGRLFKAKDYFLRSLQHQPDRRYALLYMAEFDIKESNYDQAKKKLALYEQKYGKTKPWRRLQQRLDQQISLNPSE